MSVFKFEDIAFNSTEKKKPVDQDKYTYLGLEHLDPDSIYVTRFGAETAPKGDKLIMKKGDVLFGKRRAYQKKVAIAPFDGIFSAHGMVLRPKEEVIDKDFFPMFIKSDYFLDAAIKISVGSLSPTINWRDLKELKFELPSLEEQRKLAEALWAIYDMKDKYKKLISATDELVQSQFVEMIGTPKYNHNNYPVRSIGEISEVLNGYAFKSKEYVDAGIKVIRIANVQKGYVVDVEPQYYPIEKESEIKNYMLIEGDILISLTGNVGRVGLLPDSMCPAALNQRVGCLRPINSIISRVFMFATLNMDSFEADCIEASNGTAQLNMSTEWLKKYEILVPPFTVQEKFSDFVKQSDKSKLALQEAIKDLDALSKKIIAENLIPVGKE